jgi:hypothetical protein
MFKFEFDYLVYIILLLIAIVLFLHYRERISKKIIMTESYANADSVDEGQLKKYDVSYNEVLKGYNEIANSYTNMKKQNNKLEPGSLADPSSYDQNFSVIKSKYDTLSTDVASKRAEIAENVATVAANYDRITGIYNSNDEKNYVRNQIANKKAIKVNALVEKSSRTDLLDELNRQVANTSSNNILKTTGNAFNTELDADSGGRYLQTLITPVYNDGLNTAKTTILNMANDAQQLVTDKVNAEIGARKRTLPNDDLSKNNGVVVRIYNKLTSPRDKLKEYIVPSINYYAASANDGIFSASKGSESRIFEFITMVRIPSGITNITLGLFTGASSALYVNGTQVLQMTAASAGAERSTSRIQVSPGDKIPIKIVAYEGVSSQESYVILKWKKGTETLFEIISSNNYFMPNMSVYSS